MRLWSLHPCYLDALGLVALWREGLLARAVLQQQTQGYQRHPQLVRFRENEHPLSAIDQYLWAVYVEAMQRGYHFNGAKLGRRESCAPIAVTRGQLDYEWAHLQAKLRQRNGAQYRKNAAVVVPCPHPLFKVCPGGIATWERVERRRASHGQ